MFKWPFVITITRESNIQFISVYCLRAIGSSIPMIKTTIRRPVFWCALAPRTPAILVTGASDKAIHGRWAGPFHADAVATTLKIKIHFKFDVD